jgi:hypothetical protein
LGVFNRGTQGLTHGGSNLFLLGKVKKVILEVFQSLEAKLQIFKKKVKKLANIHIFSG